MLVHLNQNLVTQKLDIHDILDLCPTAPISLEDDNKRAKFIGGFYILLDGINLECIDEWYQRAYKQEYESLKCDLKSLIMEFNERRASLPTAESDQIKPLVKKLDKLYKRFEHLIILKGYYENPSAEAPVRGMILRGLRKISRYSSIHNKKIREDYIRNRYMLKEWGNPYLSDGGIVVVQPRTQEKTLDNVLVFDMIESESNNFPLAKIVGREQNNALPELIWEETRELREGKFRYIVRVPNEERTILCRCSDEKRRESLCLGKTYQAIIKHIKDNKWYGHLLNQSPSEDNPVYDVNPMLAKRNKESLQR